MASKVNSKFVLFLVLSIGVAAMIIGGLLVLNMRGNAQRSFRLAAEAEQAGDMKRARDYYGRAVHKEPGNLEYLACLERVILQLEPKTANEATDMYREWVGVLNHAARHDSQNVNAQLRLINELFNAARRSNGQWELLGKAAEDMWNRLPESEPQRKIARVMLAMSKFRRSTLCTLEEITESVQEMQTIAPAMGDNDLAWSTLVHGEMVLLEKLREQGRTGSIIDEQNAKIDETVKKAVAAVPNGPETARMNLLNTIVRNVENPKDNPNETVQAAADRLMALIPENVEPGFLGEAADLMLAVRENGAKRAIELHERNLKHNPKADDSRLSAASLWFSTNQLDQAEQAAKQIIAAEPMKVGYLSQIQAELRKRAAALVVDIYGRRWSDAPNDEKPGLITAMEEARAKLSELVADPVNDTQMLRADARIAFAKGDYPRAAKCCDRLVRESNFGRDPETLYFSAISLERINQLGLAYERTLQALEITPKLTPLIITKARLEYNMGKRTEAGQTLATLPSDELKKEEVQQLIALINSGAGEQIAQNPTDPVLIALSQASSYMNQGDNTAAKSTLEAQLRKTPEAAALLIAMVEVELRSGNSDSARDFLARAKKADPENVNLLRFDALLENQDPIDALMAFHKSAIKDEKEQSLTIMAALRRLAIQQFMMAQNLATNNMDDAGAAKARTLAERAKSEMNRIIQEASSRYPNDPRLVEFMFDEAMGEKDWAKAEKYVATARANDLDQAGGAFYQGRLDLARAMEKSAAGQAQEARKYYQDAVRSLESATDRLSFSSTIWRALAVSFQSLGNFPEAERAFEQAYKCNPNDMDAVRSYVSLLLRRGETTRSLRILRDALKLVPNDVNMRHRWLLLEADAGDRLTALLTRRRLFRENPDDVLNAAELARLLSHTVPTPDNMTDETGRRLYTEQHWSRLTVAERNEALSKAQTDLYRQADEILDSLTKRLGEDLRFVSLRASLLRDRGDIMGGEQLLRDYIARKGDAVTSEILLELGRYQVQSTHLAEAKETFTAALSRQDPKRREADQELADLYMRSGNFDEALKHLQNVLGVRKEIALQNQAVECLLKLKRFDEAERSLSEIVAQNGDDVTTAMLASSIAEGRADELLAKGDTAGAERKFAQQRETLSRAFIMDPSNPTPRLLFAQMLLKEARRTGRTAVLDDGLHTLEEIEKVRVGIPEVGVMRVNLLKEKGDIGGAIGELRRLLDRFPSNHAARRELTQIYYDQGNGEAAIAAIKEGIRVNPTLHIWHDALGDLYKLTKGDPTLALDAYSKAFELNPVGMSLLKVADATFAMPAPDCEGLAEKMKTRMQDMESNPFLREAYARALHCAKNRDAAVEQLRLAYATRQQQFKDGKAKASDISYWFQPVSIVFGRADNPSQVDGSAAEQFVLELCGGKPDVYMLHGLSRLWLATGDPKMTRGIELQRQAVAQCPPEEESFRIDLQLELATYLYGTAALKEAADLYEAVIKTHPERLDALNNVAYLLADELKEPARALPYAEKAHRLAQKDDWSVLDTVGWVYVLAGQVEKGQQVLQDSIRAQRSAIALFHLAASQFMSGDITGATHNLEEAARMNPDAFLKGKMDRLQAEIAARRGR